MAEQVKAKIITSHCGTIYSYKEIEDFNDEKRKNLKKDISENLHKLDKHSIILGIENIPYPAMGHAFFSIKDMLYDPIFADPLELYDFTKEKNFKITFDTRHWGTLNIPISLLNIFKKIEDQVCLIHLSDVYGKWLDKTCIYKQGVIPGQGNLGEKNFQSFLSYLKNCPKKIGMTLEIEDQDLKNPKQSQQALETVLNWLNYQ